MLSSHYNPAEIEDKWYQHWMEQDYFASTPDDREPFTIVIPPPNVTGKLHMGHMLNNSIQDILIRKARLDGKNACWVPGTDHASIATEAKVVKMLREKGIKKSDLSRDEFMKYAWEWKEKYGGIILEQLKKLGASADWSRTRFTMEPKLSKAVIKVFIDLHKKGKIYRGKRMTNWDPEALTVLSNEEVIYSEEKSKLYHVRYKIEGDPLELPHIKTLSDTVNQLTSEMENTRNDVACKKLESYHFVQAHRRLKTATETLSLAVAKSSWITIATTRPETILGDSAIAVNPKDERYFHLHGKRAIVPMANRSVPIIADRYVEIGFGTGALKVTPAHDMNDNEIGARHDLEVIDVFNDNGTMSEEAGFYVGEDRFEVRTKIVKDLEKLGHIVKVEAYNNNVGRSERTNAIIEPRLTMQWFLGMKEFANTALKAVKSGEVRFYPEHFWNMYYNWLNEDNIRDWCISRQLWWGQRIPAYYLDGETYVGETPEEALAMAKEKTGNNNLTIDDLKQDEDVLDTWFSSWLWPISVFDGFETQAELKYYYPTNTLVTGWDIMFFWVARMIMSGYEWSGDLLGEAVSKEKGVHPFKDVYFTGMVRDEKRRKMSKSLGNSPDALKLIEHYGADGVRFGMLSSGSAGNDIVFDAVIDPKTKVVKNESAKCDQGLKFCNKIWNALKMLKGLEIVEQPANEAAAKVNQLAGEWMTHKLNKTLVQLEQSYEQYRLSEALVNLYNFIWNDFFSEYLEMIKPDYQKPIDRATYNQAIQFFETIMTVLHPFMPFVTEEIWHQLKDRKKGADCIISTHPKAGVFDDDLIRKVDSAIDVITKIRFNRNSKGLKAKDPLKLYVQNSDGAKTLFAMEGIHELITKRAFISELSFTDEEEIEKTISFVSGTEKYLMEINKEIDVEEEKEQLTKELSRAKGFVFGIEKKLSNERFVSNAPAAVVDKEKQKMEDGLARIKMLEESLGRLN